MLKELGNVNIVGTFTDPAEAVESTSELEPDVIFLDIEMPELSGQQAAEILHTRCPRAIIVFLTAYNIYAVDAFELNALDYVLKPVNRNRLLKTIQRLEERLKERSVADSSTKLSDATMIRCFQSLRFERGGQQLPNIRWRTSKAQELFAYLLHNSNRFVSKDMLIELLWPDFVFKKASTLLYTTIYQVRQCLKQGEIDLRINNVITGEGYSLETDGLQIDIMEWEKGI
ncbi:response regulator, partial [Marinimicrococcus flavescens]|nr:response regulator [Marinimicrococcus flavescens]